MPPEVQVALGSAGGWLFTVFGEVVATILVVGAFARPFLKDAIARWVEKKIDQSLAIRLENHRHQLELVAEEVRFRHQQDLQRHQLLAGSEFQAFADCSDSVGSRTAMYVG